MFNLLILVSFFILADFRLGFLAAFLYGIWADLSLAQNLGVSPLKFLAITLIINLYKRKFNAENMLFVLPITFAVLWYFKLENSYFALKSLFSLRDVLAYTVLMYPLFFVLVRIKYIISYRNSAVGSQLSEI